MPRRIHSRFSSRPGQRRSETQVQDRDLQEIDDFFRSFFTRLANSGESGSNGERPSNDDAAVPSYEGMSRLLPRDSPLGTPLARPASSSDGDSSSDSDEDDEDSTAWLRRLYSPAMRPNDPLILTGVSDADWPPQGRSSLNNDSDDSNHLPPSRPVHPSSRQPSGTRGSTRRPDSLRMEVLSRYTPFSRSSRRGTSQGESGTASGDSASPSEGSHPLSTVHILPLSGSSDSQRGRLDTGNNDPALAEDYIDTLHPTQGYLTITEQQTAPELSNGRNRTQVNPSHRDMQVVLPGNSSGRTPSRPLQRWGRSSSHRTNSLGRRSAQSSSMWNALQDQVTSSLRSSPDTNDLFSPTLQGMSQDSRRRTREHHRRQHDQHNADELAHKPSSSGSLTDTLPISPPLDCSFLSAGMQFRGHQTAMGPAYFGSSNEICDMTVAIDQVDPVKGQLKGTMKSTRVNNPSCEATTFWEGEILDFKRVGLCTGKWQSNSATDRKFWKHFKGLSSIWSLSSRKSLESVDPRMVANIQKEYILMRWKERFLITTSPEYNELSISGFYYICMSRSDGIIRGYYHDSFSEPYQMLLLMPEIKRSGASFPSYSMT
ncbi:hypothetical protein IWQ62_001110 [Dispira parvispora]|uniref:Vacuolar import and degradation protein-domain-containing protein n=1 Tax=Dispira parvispora TaxID=1520584 RepID=A0A9W8AT72_9FUNG|nr:hypothetical protein IWQ62_001110 [Dispira parvispora]